MKLRWFGLRCAKSETASEVKPSVAAVPELSGIEKHWREEDEKRKAETEAKRKERYDKLSARKAEIEKKIAPELQELAALCAELYPQLQFNALLQQQALSRAYSGGPLGLASGLGSLSSFLGRVA